MWSPDQYERFRTERKQPFIDLAALVEKRPSMSVVDLGCGSGELTRELHTALGARKTVGIDSSAEMLSRAKEGDGVSFREETIEAFRSEEPLDLIFSNAAFHWVPHHEALFRRLAGQLAADGQMAVQMPANDDHPSHRVAAEVASEMGVAPRPDYLLPLERYARLLHELGFKRQHVRMQVYGHLLPSSSDVVEWVRGALLTDYQERMESIRFDAFIGEYTHRLLKEIGERSPYFYTYNRILIWASR